MNTIKHANIIASAFADEVDTRISALENRKARLIELARLQNEVYGMELSLLRTLPDSVRASQAIIRIVCLRYHCDASALLSASRAQPLAFYRQVAMCLMRETVRATLESIGQTFDRDHGTVMHACRIVHNRCDTSSVFADDFAELTTRCVDALKQLQCETLIPDSHETNP